MSKTCCSLEAEYLKSAGHTRDNLKKVFVLRLHDPSASGERVVPPSEPTVQLSGIRCRLSLLQGSELPFSRHCFCCECWTRPTCCTAICLS